MMGGRGLGDDFEEIPRRIKFVYRWGARVHYQFDLGGHTVLVRTPFVRHGHRGKQFEFELPGGETITASFDSAAAITLRSSDEVIAEFAPALSLSEAEIKGRPKHKEVATVWIGEQRLPLICSVLCDYCPYDYRILSATGSRMCYWRKTGGWGTGSAILLISKRVAESFLPVAISATLISLMLDNAGD